LNDQDKTKDQLIEELASLRERLSQAEVRGAAQEGHAAWLREMEGRYRAVMETFPEPYAEQDLQGNLVYFNKAYREEMGYTAEELQGLNYRVMMPGDHADRAFRIYREVFKTGNPAQSSDLESVNKIGEKMQYEVSISLIRDLSGNPAGFRSFYHNVTASRQVEEDLRRSSKLLDEIIQGIQAAVTVHGPDSRITASNKKAQELLGLSEEQLRGKAAADPAWKFLRADGTVSVPEEYPVNLVLKTGKPIKEIMGGIFRPDLGETIWVLVNAVPQCSPDGEMVRIIVTFVDLTGHKRAEERLRQNELLLRTVFDSVQDFIFFKDLACRFVMVSKSFAERLGTDPSDILGKTDREVPALSSDETELCLVEDTDRRALRGEVPDYDYSRLLDGRKVNFHVIKGPIRDEHGEVMGICGVARDVTERMVAQKALNESEERFRRLAENAQDMIYRMSLPEGTYEYVSPAAVDITGYTPGEYYRQPLLVKNAIHPDWQDYFAREWEALLAGQPPPFYEYKFIHRSGEERWLYQRNVLVRDEQGIPLAIEGIVTDMTARKKVEEDLRVIQERMELALQGADLGMYDFNLRTGAGYVDKRHLSITGYTEDDLPAYTFERWQASVHPDDHDRVKKTIRGLVNGDQQTTATEYRLRHKSGAWVWVLSRGKVVRWDERGRPLRFAGTLLNISDRKQAEEALHQSEARLRLITDHMTDLIIMTDRDMKIQYISPSIKPLTGYDVSDRTERSIMEFVHPDDIQAINAMIDKTLPTYSPPGKVEYRFKHARGEYIWLEAAGAYMLDENRQFLGAVINIRDITERKRMEGVLKQTLDELESRVQDRTFELQEINTALRVLLKNREEDQKNLQESLQSNINHLVMPFLNKLKLLESNGHCLEYLNVLEANLNNVTSPFINKLSEAYKSLSPRELQVAAMIKQGKSSKEIAEVFGISIGTVNSYRNNIREKLQLISTETNLRSFLLSLP